jgi:hypothetical protein
LGRYNHLLSGPNSPELWSRSVRPREGTSQVPHFAQDSPAMALVEWHWPERRFPLDRMRLTDKDREHIDLGWHLAIAPERWVGIRATYSNGGQPKIDRENGRYQITRVKEASRCI